MWINPNCAWRGNAINFLKIRATRMPVHVTCYQTATDGHVPLLGGLQRGVWTASKCGNGLWGRFVHRSGTSSGYSNTRRYSRQCLHTRVGWQCPREARIPGAVWQRRELGEILGGQCASARFTRRRNRRWLRSIRRQGVARGYLSHRQGTTESPSVLYTAERSGDILSGIRGLGHTR